MINNRLLKKMGVMFLSVTLFSMNALEGEIGLFIPGISYHIGANASNPAYQQAPRGLDKNGAFVVNPGIGIVYDKRNKEDGSSLAWSAMAITFKDCDDRAAFAIGVGGNYRYYLNKHFSLHGDLYISAYIAQDWKTSEYHTSLVPFPSVGINYHLSNMSNLEGITIGIKTTFSPKNGSHSSTAGFNLLFSYLYIGYSF